MFRLYLSLYFTCALCLGTSAWFLESYNSQSGQLSNLEKQLIANYLNDTEQTEQTGAKNLLTKVPLSSIHLSEELFQQLQTGQTLTVEDNQQQWYFYKLSASAADDVLIFGPFSSAGNNNASFIKFIFYLSIAVAVFLGCWPLFRDINRLQLATYDISRGALGKHIQFSRFSMIKDIGDTFNQMSQQLSRRVTTQRELINAVSHDFLTPISRAKFALEVHDDKQCQSLQNIDLMQDLVELEILVEEFLTYAELQQCKPQFVHRIYTAKDLIMPCIGKFSVYSELVINLNNHQQNISVDQRSFQRILQNLLGNAVRFARQHIIVSIEQTSMHWELSVSDDGPGFAEHKKSYLLKAFNQDEKGNEEIYQGVGLGLAIIKQLCHWQHGELQIETCPILGGARFKVRIPHPKNKIHEA
ncbi:ATP-binding protein [Thalassotalea litorea]|uniref:ATP-binding protein n=1 Tax=Thalassotalea litorea TaxID=2020715 RepID=UPI0037362FB3